MFLPLYVICWWQAEISWSKVQGKMVSQYLILYFLSHNELACNLCLTVWLLERVYQYSCIYLLKYGTLGFPQSDSSSSLTIKIMINVSKLVHGCKASMRAHTDSVEQVWHSVDDAYYLNFCSLKSICLLMFRCMSLLIWPLVIRELHVTPLELHIEHIIYSFTLSFKLLFCHIKWLESKFFLVV